MIFPVALSGNTLGARQQELNARVRQAAADNVPFQQVIDGAERDDIDRLFKIDLAARYKNVDYIIDTFKCGDSLYITRALKCAWLYDDEFSIIINPNYLSCNLFPFMPARMQRKLLTMISIHVRNEARSEEFYRYCMKIKLKDIAKKFLVSTSFQFKKHMIENELDTVLKRMFNDIEIVNNIIRNDIALAECYLIKIKKEELSEALYMLRNLYSIDPETYLNWIEKYKYDYHKTLGSRTSRHIMNNFKKRVVNNFDLYINVVRRGVFVKHTTANEAVQYLKHLLPRTAQGFWEVGHDDWSSSDCSISTSGFYGVYRYLLDIIVKEQHYKLIKKLFNEKYPGSEFEMAEEFISQGYHHLMTVEEREAWALCHIEADKEKRVRDKRYVFYGYVKYDIALEAIKKYVLITPDANDRAKVLHILVESTRSMSDVEKLLNYYYQRHVNEDVTIKENFLKQIMSRHDIYEFQDNCWRSFQKLLYSLEVYNPAKDVYKDDYLQQAALVFHIVNNIEIASALKFLLDVGSWNGTEFNCIEQYTNKLTKEKQIILCQFLLNLYVNKLKEYEYKPIDKDNNAYTIECRLSVIHSLKDGLKLADDNLPDIVPKMKKILDEYLESQRKEPDTISQAELIRLLKKYAPDVVKKWPKVKYTIQHSELRYFKLNTFLKKLRVYFMQDIAQDYLKFFKESLTFKGSESISILIPVYGIFQIADTKYKTEFVEEYVPVNPKIDHSEIDRHYLYIQEGICRYVGYSRPPVPQSVVRRYITGDYLQYCVPMFNMNMANLRPAECQQFAKSLLDSPVSIQKHAIRMAFQCFNFEELMILVRNIWKNSKNISLRMIIYTSVFKEVVRRDGAARDDMFKYLLELMSELNENDHEDALGVLSGAQIIVWRPVRRQLRHRGTKRVLRTVTYRTMSRCIELPDEYKAAYIEAGWKTVNNFPNKERHVELRTKVICKMIENFHKINKTILRAIVDDYFNTLFNKNGIRQLAEQEKMVGDDYKEVIEAKEKLAFKFIQEERQNTDCIELVRSEMRNCFKSWDEVIALKRIDNCYVFFVREYCFRFIRSIVDYNRDWTETGMNKLLTCILEELLDVLPMHEIYMDVWQFRFKMITYTLMDTAYKLRSEQNERTKITLFEELIYKLAEEVCKIVTQFVTEQKFCITFLENISKELTTNMEMLQNAIDCYYSLDKICILTASRLLDYGKLETDFLAEKILPVMRWTPEDIWNNVIVKLEASDNFEMKSRMGIRFKLQNFKKIIIPNVN